MKKNFKLSHQSYDYLGVRVDAVTEEQIHEFISWCIADKGHALILHTNIYGLNLAYEQSWYRNFINSGDIVFCDGAGVQLFGKIMGNQIPERITYAEWMWKLAELAEQKEFSLYFLGGRPGVAEKARLKLQGKHKALNVVGTYHGYFDKTKGSDDNEIIISEVNELKPDILVVGFGMPLQEKWLLTHWDRLDVKIGLTGGAVFDYVSGELRRPPSWMTNNSLEWLGRLIIEPRRLWIRYLIGNPLFLYRMVKYLLNNEFL